MSRMVLPESDSEDELPPGWEERTSDEGQVFYMNRRDDKTQWAHPRTGKTKRVQGELPFGWSKQIEDGSGNTIYVEAKTGKQTYIDPRLAFAQENVPQNISHVRQRFDAGTTSLQVLHGRDLNGKVAVITGANSGIGFETARSLALHGCEIYLACRSEASTAEAIARIREEKPAVAEKCHFVPLDLASLRSVGECARQIKLKTKHIDMLILNAGVFALPHILTEDGLETTFQVSHLSHFYLTLLLEDCLNHMSRVVVLSSESHRFSYLPPSHLNEQVLSPPPHRFYSMIAYNDAKLCNVLFARGLAKRWCHKGVCVYAVHPGNMVSSNIARNYWFYRVVFALVRPFTKSLQQAASTAVYCATASELTGITGQYFNNCFFCEPSKRAQNEEMADNLWTVSEAMVKGISEKHGGNCEITI